VIDFDSLWANHPSPFKQYPCVNDLGRPNFENQCAIRLGVALSKLHINLRAVRSCWFKGHVGHTLAAEELARWLEEQSRLVGTPLKFRDGKKALGELQGKKGIVFCMNFWGAGRNGDHIDVWNGSKMKGGNGGYMLDSQAVWFWKLA
jgi:hypothetical protein